MSKSPQFSVVVPSYNQGRYIERTLCSIFNQNWDDTEVIVIDGGSKDDTIEIIKRYEARIAHWVSEKDGGQTAAINTGLRMAKGDWVGWQNSDDCYLPGSFAAIAKAIARFPKADVVIGDILLVDEDDRALRDVRYVRPTYGALLAEGMVLANQAAFWRRDLHDELGWLNESFHCSFDYEWFLRMLERHCAVHVPQILGAFRLHDEAKSARFAEDFSEENRQILHGRQLAPWLVQAYRGRRMLGYLLNGNLAYVLRGLRSRAGFAAKS